MAYYGFYVERQGWTHWPKVLIMHHRTGQGPDESRKYFPERKCQAIDTGYATAFCSECGCEFMGSIMTNEPPDYVKPLERCPRCGAIIEETV